MEYLPQPRLRPRNRQLHLSKQEVVDRSKDQKGNQKKEIVVEVVFYRMFLDFPNEQKHRYLIIKKLKDQT